MLCYCTECFFQSLESFHWMPCFEMVRSCIVNEDWFLARISAVHCASALEGAGRLVYSYAGCCQN
jgi:hypothetical protein